MTSARSVKLNDELQDRIQRLAESRRRSAHWIMREAIVQYVEREEEREAYLHDAQNARYDFQPPGRHITAEDDDEWLIQLSAGSDAGPPECHR